MSTTHNVWFMVAHGILQDAGGRFRLLQLVVDTDERLEVVRGGAPVELVLFVVQGLGERAAVHGTLPQQARVQW